MWAQPLDVKWQQTDLVLFSGFPPPTISSSKPTVVVEANSSAEAWSTIARQTSTTLTFSVSTSPTDSQESPSSSDRGSHMMGVGVGVGVGVAFLTAVLVFLIYWRQKVWARRNAEESRVELDSKSNAMLAEMEGNPPPREIDDDRNKCELEAREEPQELEEEKKESPASPVELAGSDVPPQKQAGKRLFGSGQQFRALHIYTVRVSCDLSIRRWSFRHGGAPAAFIHNVSLRHGKLCACSAMHQIIVCES